MAKLTTPRKQYTPEFKAQLVRRILKDERSVPQIASENELNPNQLYRWRDIALQGLPTLFADGRSNDPASNTSDHDEQLQTLYAEIGKLTTELAALRRKFG